MKKLPERLKWTSQNQEFFNEALKKELTKKEFEDVMNEDESSPEKCISQLSNALLKCVDRHTGAQARENKHKYKTNDKPWFDKDCRGTQKELRVQAKKLRHSPNNNSVREKLHQ